MLTALFCALSLSTGCVTRQHQSTYERAAARKWRLQDLRHRQPKQRIDVKTWFSARLWIDGSNVRSSVHSPRRALKKPRTNPDFRVTFNTITKDKDRDQRLRPPPFRRKPFYGYSGRYIDIDQYEEGTFIIDIIDSESSQLVWRGSLRETTWLERSQRSGSSEDRQIDLRQVFRRGSTPTRRIEIDSRTFEAV